MTVLGRATPLERVAATHCWPCSTPTAGGRACSTPTSRWTPRTCCSASSSACSRPSRRRPRRRGSARSSATTAPGPRSTAGPADLSTTVEAYVALRLAGDPADAAHLREGPGLHPRAGRHRGHPGLHPAVAGAVRGVAVGRPAGTAARGDAAAAVVPAQHLRLRLLGPPDDRAAHRRERPPPGAPPAVRPRRARSPARAPPRAPRRCARGPAASTPSTGCCTATSAARRGPPPPAPPWPRAERWIVQRQEADGSWGGIQPPWVYSMIALASAGLSRSTIR